MTVQLARQAGELLGATGLSGQRCDIDAIGAATAVTLEPPIVLLISDPDDMNKLVSESGRPKAERIAVVRVSAAGPPNLAHLMIKD